LSRVQKKKNLKKRRVAFLKTKKRAFLSARTKKRRSLRQDGRAAAS